MVDRRVHRRRRPGVRGADPPARGERAGRAAARARRRLRRRPDQPAGGPAGRRLSSGSTRRGTASASPRERGGASFARARGGRAAVRRRQLRRRRRLSGVRAHRATSTRRSPRSAGCWSPAVGSASSSTIRCCRPRTADGSTTTCSIRPSSTGGSARTSSSRIAIEEVEKDVFIPFIHRPLSRYVNALADERICSSSGCCEPAPPAGFLERAERVRRCGNHPAAAVSPNCESV